MPPLILAGMLNVGCRARLTVFFFHFFAFKIHQLKKIALYLIAAHHHKLHSINEESSLSQRLE